MNTLRAALFAIFAALLYATTAHAAFTLNAAADEVTDSRTGLIWKRCPEGMSWSINACSGTAQTFTHEQALARATTQAGSAGWRLPNVKELTSLADRSRSNPAIDTAYFPNTPSNYFWSSSPDVASSLNAWNVYFYDGDVDGNGRSSSYYVRLVRASQ